MPASRNNAASVPRLCPSGIKHSISTPNVRVACAACGISLSYIYLYGSLYQWKKRKSTSNTNNLGKSTNYLGIGQVARRSNILFVPTDEQRATVRGMAAIGIEQANIARIMKIAPKTLRKHFREELDLAMDQANAAVGGAMFKAATTKGPGQVTAGIWWTKTRMGWREPAQVHQHSGPDGEPIQVHQITRVIIRPGDADKAAAGKGKRAKKD
jgi:hypothetical protein